MLLISNLKITTPLTFLTKEKRKQRAEPVPRSHFPRTERPIEPVHSGTAAGELGPVVSSDKAITLHMEMRWRVQRPLAPLSTVPFKKGNLCKLRPKPSSCPLLPFYSSHTHVNSTF